MSIKIVFEDENDCGEILLDNIPVEFQSVLIVEAAIRQLRAEIAERDARVAELKIERDNLFLAQAGNLDTFLNTKLQADRAEAELARLLAQTHIATVCLITDRSAHGHIIEAQLQIDPAAQLPIGTKLYAEQVPAPSLKDHEIAQLVNALRDCAVEFHAAQQLRERIAAIVVPMLRGVRSPMSAKDSK